MIYLISGKKGSGKDTVADYIKKRKGLPRLSFASPIKDITKNILGVKDSFFSQEGKEKKLVRIFKYVAASSFDDHCIDTSQYTTLSPREILQSLGQYMREEVSENFWVGLLLNKVDKENIKEFTISDVRYKNEIEELIENFGKQVVTIRVERNTKLNKYSKHISEVDLDEYEFNHIIKNNGTYEDLYIQIDRILLQYEKGEK